MISNRLHYFMEKGDIVELTAPAGEFMLDIAKPTPVILVSDSVGQMPLLNMLEYLISTDSNREVLWVHGSRNPQVHAFRQPVTELAARHEQVQQHIFYVKLATGPEQEDHY